MTSGADVWSWHHEPVLGTVVQIRIEGCDEPTAERLQRVVLDEIDRLEAIFTVYDERSELRRWAVGTLDDEAIGPELRGLLAVAAGWHRRSGGAFHPLVGALMARWRAAERSGVEPTPDECLLAAQAIAELPYVAAGPPDGAAVRIERRADCGALDLNAIAKGHIVDRAVACGLAAAAAGEGPMPGRSVLVNAGGDLLHRGAGSILAGVEDPRRAFDNAAPIVVVELADGALATSGPTKRGFRIGSRWYGHVLDPRRGVPVEGLLSASVIAPDATTADAVATVVGVFHPAEALAFVAPLDRVGCCVLDAEGTLWRDPYWSACERPLPG